MFEMLIVFEVEVKMKVEMEVKDSLAHVCFTIFKLQQLSVATEYSTLSVDLCEIPKHTQIRVNCTAVINSICVWGWLVLI